jgi:class 3 adenylate cyclase
MGRCPSCERELPSDFSFCPFCGAAATAMSDAPREERKVVTVLFVDLVGFTARAEQLDPEDVRALLAPYHAHVREELERFGGTVEKFIGDAVMALYAGGDFTTAADLLHTIGSLPDEAEARLRAAEQLSRAGRGDDARSQLARANDFFRSVRAVRYQNECRRLLAAAG